MKYNIFTVAYNFDIRLWDTLYKHYTSTVIALDTLLHLISVGSFKPHTAVHLNWFEY
jgi:hypothetical protein